MFFDIMDYLKILFLIMKLVRIQILEEFFWTIKHEGEVVVNLPLLDIHKQMEWINQILEQYLHCIVPIIIKIIG
jgi:hypothetical protein